jgi:predicted PurR-regulated permease PerM
MASDWQRALVALAATVVTAAIVAVLFWGRTILIPVALAVFLSFVLAPIVARLQRRGLGRAPAVVVTVGVLMLVTAGVGFAVLQQLGQLAETLPDRRETIKQKLLTAKEWLGGRGESRFGQLVDEVGQIVSPKRPQHTVVVEQASALDAQLEKYASPAAEALGQAAFTFILTVFMLLKREDLRNRMIWLVGSGRVTTTTKAVDDASHRISRYLLSQLIINTTFGVIITLGLLALGVKYSVLWGFIATVMRYVPYVGTWVGLIPPTLFSLATAPDWGAWAGGWGQPLAVLALFLGLEAICNNLVEPYVYGQSMGLSEVAQLVMAALWAFLWGPIGLILSGPLTVCLLVLGRHVRRLEFFAVLLGDQPALEPQVAYYQRLAARDQDEAAEVAVGHAKRTSPEEAFDGVVLPALCLARHDRDEGALDPNDLRFIVGATREIAEEVGDLRKTGAETAAEERLRVLICPARDDAEHVAAHLLALSLDPNRWEARVAGDETLASELVEQVGDFRPAAVVIVTLPPGGLSHARYLVARLRKRFPDVPLLVGRWGVPADDIDVQREAVANTDGLDRTLSGTRERLGQLYPLLVAERKKLGPAADREVLIGTGNA